MKRLVFTVFTILVGNAIFAQPPNNQEPIRTDINLPAPVSQQSSFEEQKPIRTELSVANTNDESPVIQSPPLTKKEVKAQQPIRKINKKGQAVVRRKFRKKNNVADLSR